MKHILITALFLASVLLHAQDPRLADFYFQSGEYEKAAALYQQLSQQSGGDYYFDRYVETLLNLNKFEDCERVIQKQIKKEPQKSSLYVAYGNVFERQAKEDKANEQYAKAVEKLSGDRNNVEGLANAFVNLNKFDFAIQTYEKGGKVLKNKYLFAYNLAELYHRKEDVPKMIDAYLNSLVDNPSVIGSVEVMLQRYLNKPEEYVELQSQVYARAQEDPKNSVFPEMLTWLFLQKKDYKNAFRQAKSVDRLNEENGARVYRIADVAETDRDYDAAIEGYEYLIAEKGRQSPFYIECKRSLLACKRKKITEAYSYTTEDLRGCEREYEAFLNEFGRGANTASIVAQLADLEAFHLKDLDKAIKLLSDLIEYPQIEMHVQAKAKISLGDFYLAKGDNWEATLLYSQVDKAFKDDTLGHTARFRNAKLSYYTGDFDWAQSQFNVLKSSTSKLIANDALDMSVFIMDNTGLDSNTTALKMYAEAELLVFQNRLDEGFVKLDSLVAKYPKHSLEDDVYYLKAHIWTQRREYDKAIAAYQFIITNYGEEIRADNSIFELAEMYETRLKDKEKARGLYEKLFTDYSGSILAVEARKRYRVLRGDVAQ